MLTTFLILITLLLAIPVVKYIHSDNPLWFLSLFLFFISFTSIFVVPPVYECKKYKKEITVKVVDKYLGESCNSKGTGCYREYVFVLETQKGYKYESNFEVDSYYRFNIGDEITYTPYDCRQSKILPDK